MPTRRRVVRVYRIKSWLYGSATMRKYPYYLATLFEAKFTKRDGKELCIYKSAGVHMGPFRSLGKAERAARDLAKWFDAEYDENEQFGNLHNQPADPMVFMRD